MITVGDLLAVAGLLCIGLIVTGGLVFLAWLTDQKKGGEG